MNCCDIVIYKMRCVFALHPFLWHRAPKTPEFPQRGVRGGVSCYVKEAMFSKHHGAPHPLGSLPSQPTTGRETRLFLPLSGGGWARV